jgi:acylphosphatase
VTVAGEATVRARLFIRGRVQGVAFRAYTEEEARSRGIDGWVRNLADGRVEVLTEGPRPEVEGLIAWCRHGPRHARVDGVEVQWEEPGGDLKGFRITG